MHVLITLIGVLGAVGYWFFVIRRASDAASEIVDAAGRARGAYRRRRFKQRAEASRIDAIDDPRVAATVMALAVAAPEGEISEPQEAVLREAMTQAMGIADPTECLVFARWAADGADANNISLRLARLWNATLTLEERRDLVDIVRRVALAGGRLNAGQRVAIRCLERRLALAA